MSNGDRPTQDQMERHLAALRVMGQGITAALERSRPKDMPKIAHVLILFPISDPSLTALTCSPGVSRAALVKVLEGSALTAQTTVNTAGRA